MINEKVGKHSKKMPNIKRNKKIKTKKEKTPEQIRKSKKRRIIILIIFVILIIILGIYTAFSINNFKSLIEDMSTNKESIIKDSSGNVIAEVGSEKLKEKLEFSEIPNNLKNAYVAIEDQRFYKHGGVDVKRTASATLSYVFHRGSSSYGGSSITQQLVKNLTGDSSSKITRKFKEWKNAIAIESFMSKDEILELYLNIIYVGPNVYGVEAGAQYYFDKPAKNLTLEECAFLAGINNSPNSYNPFNDTDNTEKINKRTKIVLSKMLELKYINENEYNEAIQKVDDGLKFKKGKNTTDNDVYSYHTDAVIDQVINQVMDEKDISRQLAENYVYSSGLTIYSTVDSTIQARLEEEYAKEKYKKTSPSKKQTTQSGMAIIDYKTGNVVGIAGGLGTKEGAGWNRATQMKKQTGSSIKPIADVAPALEEKIITPATVYDDVKTDFGGGYTPKNDGERYRGIINIRQFIETSQNIPALKIMKELTPEKSIQYLKKMGITSLDDKKDNVLSLAIGGMTDGVSPLEMAAAYGTIANDGVYITPTFYTKVVDSSGNTILTPKQEHVRAVSEQTAYLTKKITQEPVNSSSGTATYCKISGMDVAAKTGTTDKSYDRWLCGFTPYYSAATWFGYDDSEEVKGFSQNPAGQIWDAVMTDIHKKLDNASFQKPSGIVEQTVCRTTGCLATTGCTDTYKEIFASNNIPEKCQGHGSQKLCTESGKIANEYCPSTKVNNYGATVPKEQLKLWTPVNGKNSTSGTKVEEICDIHKKPAEKPKEPEKPKENTTNTGAENTTNTGGNTNTSGNTSTGENTTNTGGNTNTTGTEDPGAGT